MTTSAINGLLDAITSSPAFAMTRSQGQAQGCCVKCGEPFTGENVRSPLEAKETQLSGMCGLCWDKIFKDAQDEDLD